MLGVHLPQAALRVKRAVPVLLILRRLFPQHSGRNQT
jgi:hypothetical protein